MKEIQSVPTKHRDAYHKYLRPGALALLRDSRICSRSHHRSRLPPLSPRLGRVAAAEAARVTDLSDHAPTGDVTLRIIDRIPVFDCYGSPRCGRRKRLFAARSVLLMSLEGRDSNGNVSAAFETFH